jgi:predicted component of type VI protein secretion system
MVADDRGFPERLDNLMLLGYVDTVIDQLLKAGVDYDPDRVAEAVDKLEKVLDVRSPC